MSLFINNGKYYEKKIEGTNWIVLPDTSIRTTKEYGDTVNLIYQFYIDKKEERQKEIRECLTKNVLNPYIDKIYLLNECHYSVEELGVDSPKIIQILINKRLTYKNIFDTIDEYKIKGYILCGNADLFFDNSLKNIIHTKLSLQNFVMCQTRFERAGPIHKKIALSQLVLRARYREREETMTLLNKKVGIREQKALKRLEEETKELLDGKYRLAGTFLPGWRRDGWRKLNDLPPQGWNITRAEHAYIASSDIWIFHSNFNVEKIDRDKLDFPLGIAGCDTYFAYIMWKLGFLLTKDPYFIKIFHHHESQIRNYDTSNGYVENRHRLGIFPYDVVEEKTRIGILPQIDNIEI